MKKILFIAIIISQLISACREDKPEGPLLIRVDNQTGFQIEEVLVRADLLEQTFGTVKQGEKSPYKEYKSAFRYAYVRLKINNVEYVQQPVDFVGEEKLAPGKHTYILELLNINNRLSLRSRYQKD